MNLYIFFSCQKLCIKLEHSNIMGSCAPHKYGFKTQQKRFMI